MLKKISAALIAVSMLAAPAMAASTTANTETAPITKSVTPAAKPQVKKARTASAKISRHHHRHYSQLRRSHKKVSASKINKTSKVSKVTIKQPGPTTKRG
jgi:ribosomal protein L18E